MKFALLVLFALVAFAIPASAHEFAPPTLATLAKSDLVWIVRVAPIKQDDKGPASSKVRFSLTDVLTVGSLNDPPPSIDLTPYPGEVFQENSEWILVHNPGGFGGCVGWAMKGDCEWLPIRVIRDGNIVSAQWIGSLDKVREYLKEHPQKAEF